MKTWRDRGRRPVQAAELTHAQLKELARIDGITIEQAHDKYAAPAVAKAHAKKAKTAPTK